MFSILYVEKNSGCSGNRVKFRIPIWQAGVSIEEENGVIQKLSEEAFFRSEAEHTDRERKEQLREDLQHLTEQEKRVLCMAYGIGCERCADARKIAGALDMRELEVRRALQSGKRKLEELADGRQ